MSGDTLVNGNGKGDWFDRVVRAIKDLGFPIVVCGVLLFHQYSTGEQLKQIMARAVAVLERLEKKFVADGADR